MFNVFNSTIHPAVTVAWAGCQKIRPNQIKMSTGTDQAVKMH